MKNITIIEFPSNLGLKEPFPDHEPGVKKLPDWLRKYKFHELIQPSNILTLTAPVYTMNVDRLSKVRNADAIIEYAKEQVPLIKNEISNKNFIIALGGDCSILIGPMLALKESGSYGLFYLDGHTDFITPEQSGTAGAAGMDLAIVAGHGHDKLTNINAQKPYVKEEHIFCVGNREYDEDYERPVKNSAVKYFDLLTLRQYGIENCVSDFLKMIEAEKLDGFWIHVDADVLNDEVMPCVDSRTSDGLLYHEFNKIIRLLIADNKAVGIELTILDPELDPSGKYTTEFVQHFTACINSVNKSNKNNLCN